MDAFMWCVRIMPEWIHLEKGWKCLTVPVANSSAVYLIMLRMVEAVMDMDAMDMAVMENTAMVSLDMDMDMERVKAAT